MQLIKWDEIRRQARTLESDLDSKLSTFGKLGLTPSSRLLLPSSTGSSTDFNLLCNEIEYLLERLNEINEKMNDLVSIPEMNNASQQHTAKRHREICYDYMQDFKRMRTAYMHTKNREELFTHTTESATRETEKQQVPEATRLLLDEQASLTHSDRMLSDNLLAASSIRSALRSQHHVLKSAAGSLLNFRNRFPLVNQLMNNINWRKRRDSIILGCVAGFCVLILLFLLFR